MVPSDNIFNIYYDIGRALPFEVQRFPKDATDWYKNQSVLVTEIHPRGKYGEALGFYLQKGERADSYWCKKDETEPQLIPCCGCSGWSLVRVIGEPTAEAKEKNPTTVLEPDDTLSFGKYKGRKVIDVYLENYQYLQWAEANVRDFLVNWQALMRAHRELKNQLNQKKTMINAMNRTLKTLAFFLSCAFLFPACNGTLNLVDDADAFVGTYNVSVVEHVVWGGDSGTLTNTGTLVITKISATRVQTSGFFRTQGEVTGKTVFFQAMHSSDSDGYMDDVFGPGTLNGNVLTVTGNTTGQLKYNGVLYPYRRTAEITAIKQH